MFQSSNKYATLADRDYSHIQDHQHESALEMLCDFIKPENELERKIISDKLFQEGVFWGEPRWGHPEGKVIFHIREVLDNVDKISEISASFRADLRITAILHDSFKHLEEQTRPRLNWDKHHAVYARKFAERYIHQKHILDLIELHDEAYYAWHLFKNSNILSSEQKLSALLERFDEEHKQLYYLFFKSDTYTGDKIIDSVLWFEDRVKGLNIVDLK